VFAEDFRHIHGHRAVEETHQLRDTLCADKLTEVEEQFLRALNGEGRDDDVATAIDGIVDLVGEVVFDFAG